MTIRMVQCFVAPRAAYRVLTAGMCFLSGAIMSPASFAQSPVAGDLVAQYQAEINDALAAEHAKDIDAARQHWIASVSLARKLNNPSWIAFGLTGQGRNTRIELRSEARVAYREALALRQSIGDAIGQAEDLHGLAQIDMSLLHDAQAIEEFQRALGLDQQTHQDRWIAFDLSFLVQLCQRDERNPEALAYLRQLISDHSLASSAAFADRLAEAYRLRSQAELEDAVGDYKEASAHSRQAVDQFDLLQKPDEAASAIVENAFSYLMRKDYVTASATLDTADAFYLALDSNVGHARVLRLRAKLEMAQGNRSLATDEVLQALKLNQGVDHWLDSELHQLLGLLYLMNGEAANALDQIGQAEELTDAAEKLSAKESRLLSRALLLSVLEQHSEAIRYLKDAQAIDHDIDARDQEVLDDLLIAKEFMLQPDLIEAQSYLKQARTLQPRDEDDNRYLMILSASVELIQGQVAEAEAEFKQVLAMPVSESPTQIETRAMALDGLARIKLLAGDNAGAVIYSEQAVQKTASLDEPDLSFRVDAGLAESLGKAGRDTEAIFFAKRAVNTIQRIRVGADTLDKPLQQALVAPKQPAYALLADLLIRNQRLGEAEQVLDLLKQEEYFEFLRGDATAGPLGQATYTSFERRWNERFEAASRQFSEAEQGVTSLRRIDPGRRTQQQNKQLRAFEAQVQDTRNGYRKLLDDLAQAAAQKQQQSAAAMAESEAVAASLRNTLKHLQPGTVILHYLVMEDRVRIMLVTSAGEYAAEKMISRSELESRVSQFTANLQNPDQPAERSAQALYDVLIRPIEVRLLGATTLAVSLQGLLRYVPIAALHDGEQWLIEKYAVVLYTPAAPSRLEEAPPQDWTVAALGVSKAYPPFKPLTWVPWELQQVMAEAGGASEHRNSDFPKLDEAFTAQALSATLKQKYQLVHIASHFQFLPGNETGSFLLLGDGQHLTLADLRNGDYPLDSIQMLTLSACQTAVSGGFRADGSEVEGLGALAQNLGARSVLASLWSIRDGPTGLLMRQMYAKRVQQHLSKSEALRQAQLSFIRGEVTLDDLPVAIQNQEQLVVIGDEQKELASKRTLVHPYFWASFILMGNWL